MFRELVGLKVFEALDEELRGSSRACAAANVLAASTHPRGQVFAAVLGLMVGDESAAGRIADRLGMTRAEGRVLPDTAGQRGNLRVLTDRDVRPSAKRRLLCSCGRLAIEAWDAWSGEPTGLSDYIESLDRAPRPLLNGHDLLRLGVPAGPPVGKMLRRLSDACLDGELTTSESEAFVLRALRVAPAETPREQGGGHGT